jgi:hypothetical protein
LTLAAYVLVLGAYLSALAAVGSPIGDTPAIVMIVAFIIGAVHLVRSLSKWKVALWVVGGILTYATYLAMWKDGRGDEAVVLVLLVTSYPPARWISDLLSKRRLSALQRRLVPSLMLVLGVALLVVVRVGGYLRFSQSAIPAAATDGCALADEKHIQWAMTDQRLPREWAIKWLCAGSIEAELGVRKEYFYSQGPDGVARWNAERQKSLEAAERGLEQLAQSEEMRPEDSGLATTPIEKPSPQTTDSQNLFSAYAAQLRSVVTSRGYDFVGDTRFVTADFEGNKLLVQRAVCSNVPGGRCEKLFIAFNNRFLGTDTFLPSWSVHDVEQEGVGSFSAVYEDLSDPRRNVPPVKVTYTWDGRKLTASGTPPTRGASKEWR